MQMNDIAAIVTGGASGLGGATATRLAQNGAKVTILDLDARLGRQKAAEIGGQFFQLDISDEEAVKSALFEAERAHGTARVLVNCAGIGPPAKVLDNSGKALALSAFSKIITVNLLGTFNVLAQFAERLIVADPLGEERGVIVNTASVAAFEGQIGQAAYSASKGGVVGMTLPIAREFARHGIRIATVAPGLFLTPLLASLPQEAQDSLGRQVPFPSRLGDPSEFAHMVESIITNPMLNGETIRLDGAIRMTPK